MGLFNFLNMIGFDLVSAFLFVLFQVEPYSEGTMQMIGY